MAPTATERRTALGDAIIEYVTNVLAEIDSYETRIDAAIAKAEQEGARIIRGAQTAEGWQITDWRTGDLLASGHGGFEGYGLVVDQLDPDHSWLHVARVRERVECQTEEVVPPRLLPATLAECLLEWAENHGDEARRFVADTPRATAGAEGGQGHD